MPLIGPPASVSATRRGVSPTCSPSALAAPNVDALRKLIPEAAEAVREVLLGVEIADAVAAHARLVDVGLIASGTSTT
ncbi:hypothetical protein [Rhodococcus sp. 06-1460-1B]|uniref:hypothetical protein n=1 Tax=Rhodococcus sp. 06-1460-1B TaxID=2022501 RepID=UPI0020CF0AFA|nr:hypothetical protein [Rhodococcus sp. 06-1460-1B]